MITLLKNEQNIREIYVNVLTNDIAMYLDETGELVKTDTQMAMEEEQKKMEEKLYKQLYMEMEQRRQEAEERRRRGEVDADNVSKGEPIRDIASHDINKYQLNIMEDTYIKVQDESEKKGRKLWKDQIEISDNLKTNYQANMKEMMTNAKRTHSNNDEMQICTNTLEALNEIGSDMAIISWAAHKVNNLWINVRNSWDAAVLSDEKARAAKETAEGWAIDVYETNIIQMGAEIGVYTTCLLYTSPSPRD